MPEPARETLVEPDAELIAGRRPVEEAFAARRPVRRLLVVPERRAALEALVLHATTLRLPVVEVEGGTLTALVGFDGHQGVALVAEPRRWGTIEEMLARAAGQGRPPFILVLDSLEDPQNMGTLLRSAEAAGVHGVIWPTHRSAPLTAAAVKASAGAVEHLLLAQVDDLSGVLVDLHSRGLRVVGADQEASLGFREADLRGPLVVVVGNESKGFSPQVRRRLDHSVRIPMQGKVASLNAAVAGSILLFEAASQREAARPATEGSAGPATEGSAGPATEGSAGPATEGVDRSAVPPAAPAKRVTSRRSAATARKGPAGKGSGAQTSVDTAGGDVPAPPKPRTRKAAPPRRATRRTAKASASPEVAGSPDDQRGSSGSAEQELLPGDATPSRGSGTTRRTRPAANG